MEIKIIIDDAEIKDLMPTDRETLCTKDAMHEAIHYNIKKFLEAQGAFEDEIATQLFIAVKIAGQKKMRRGK